jgi:hypothetical protein
MVPPGQKVTFSAYTGTQRPVRMSDYQKTLQRWGVTDEQLRQMSKDDIRRLIRDRAGASGP